MRKRMIALGLGDKGRSLPAAVTKAAAPAAYLNNRYDARADGRGPSGHDVAGPRPTGPAKASSRTPVRLSLTK